MNDQNRTKILAGVLAVVLVFVFIKPHEWLLQPIRDAELELQRARDDYERAEEKETELRIARGNIEEVSQFGLPPRRSDALRVYQRWITNLAEQSGFAQLKVTPGSARTGSQDFSAVEVRVTAEANMEKLSRFLYYFDHARLVHRVEDMDIKSTGTSQNASLVVSLKCVGLSMKTGAPKSDVFARTELTKDLSSSGNILTVAEVSKFPEDGEFLLQVGREMMTVTNRDGDAWEVEREEGRGGSHQAGDSVQAFLVAERHKDVSLDDYKELVSFSPFAKPVPPKQPKPPAIEGAISTTIAPGDLVSMKPGAANLDPLEGEIRIEVEGELKDGMSIEMEDDRKSSFKWQTAEDIEDGEYEVTFLLSQANHPTLTDTPLKKTVKVTVRLPNASPEITTPADAVVILGQDFSLDVSATDDGDENDLKFSVSDAPEGLEIDSSTGTLTWTPPKTFVPGDYSVKVTVTDSGRPARTDSGSIELKVQDDNAILTRFTGSVGLNGTPVAWFRNVATNDRPEVRVGDRLTAAEIDVEVKEIGARHVLLADASGVWKLKLGDNLRDRQLIEPAVKEDASDAGDAADDPAEVTATDEDASAAGDSETTGDAETADATDSRDTTAAEGSTAAAADDAADGDSEAAGDAEVTGDDAAESADETDEDSSEDTAESTDDAETEDSEETTEEVKDSAKSE